MLKKVGFVLVGLVVVVTVTAIWLRQERETTSQREPTHQGESQTVQDNESQVEREIRTATEAFKKFQDAIRGRDAKVMYHLMASTKRQGISLEVLSAALKDPNVLRGFDELAQEVIVREEVRGDTTLLFNKISNEERSPFKLLREAGQWKVIGR